MEKVEEAKGTEVDIDWQPFSLAQVNSKEGPDYKVWEQPEIINGTDKTLLAHQAGLAAKRQGKDAFKSFFNTLLAARHEDKVDLNDPEVIEAAATKSGLDVAQFREDLVDPDLLREIGESHTRAVEEVGAFGVPTFVFPGGKSAFLKMFPPPAEQAEEIFDSLIKTMSEFAHVGEIKRPSPPWPHDVI